MENKTKVISNEPKQEKIKAPFQNLEEWRDLYIPENKHLSAYFEMKQFQIRLAFIFIFFAGVVAGHYGI